MKEKISTVRNPLTVIAIFAGTAEISGTAILPFLEAQNQQIYIWFLMLFPLILIVFFFITLNWNHKVLYAPSDFTNEDNFVNILKKPSIQETISKIENDLEESENENEKANLERKTEEISKDGREEEISDNILKSAKDRESNDVELAKNFHRQRMQESQLAELLVLNKLEQELNSPIQREMMIKIGDTQVIFDGVVQVGSKLTGIEIKYLRSRKTLNSSMWNKMIKLFENLYKSLSDAQKKSFSLIFAIVTDEDPEDIKRLLKNKTTDLSFPVQIRVYNFNQLRNESFHG